MSTDASDAPVSNQQGRAQEPNDLLRRARLSTPSPNDRTKPMSQRELAEAVTAHVFRTTARIVPLDRHYISRLERGRSRWPTADYRNGFRAVLGVATDAELGFYVKPRASGAPLLSRRPRVGATSGLTVQSTGTDVPAVQLVVSPGTAVVLLPINHAVLSALVPTLSTTDLQQARKVRR